VAAALAAVVSAQELPTQSEVLQLGRPLASALVVRSGPVNQLSDIGKGKAVIFSPDLAVPGNRLVYERLGFLYIETADWLEVLDQLSTSSARNPDSINMVIVESHGTNGTGLKLQWGKKPEHARSYIAVGALQEHLGAAGIRTGVITACNSGRLFRPKIYNVLSPDPDEPLFLPATLGILQASSEFDSARSEVIMLRPVASNLESLIEGQVSELNGAVAALFPTVEGADDRFVVSALLIEILLDDPRLQLTGAGYEEKLSKADLTLRAREALFERLLSYIDSMGLQEICLDTGSSRGTELAAEN